MSSPAQSPAQSTHSSNLPYFTPLPDETPHLISPEQSSAQAPAKFPAHSTDSSGLPYVTPLPDETPHLISLHDWDFASVRKDMVTLKDLAFYAKIGLDSCGEKKQYGILVSIELPDDGTTENYAGLCQAIKALEKSIDTYHAPHDAAFQIAEVCSQLGFRDMLKVCLHFPEASSVESDIQYELLYEGGRARGHILSIKNLSVYRKAYLDFITVNLTIDPLTSPDMADLYGEMEQIVIRTILETDSSSPLTLRRLATKITSNIMKLYVFPASLGSVVILKLQQPMTHYKTRDEGRGLYPRQLTSSEKNRWKLSERISRSSTLEDPFAEKVWEECSRANLERIPIPFPEEETLQSHLLPRKRSPTPQSEESFLRPRTPSPTPRAIY
ncbi:MAG: hypothetical protein M1816_004704 [Peltula sp. TS41687]|nr:MAG: hypothetical protein M1816_004704 [Peltula sp. TS41687]